MTPNRKLTMVQVSGHAEVGDLVYRVHGPAESLGRSGLVDVYDVDFWSRWRDDLAVAADILVVFMVRDRELFRVIEQRRRLRKPTFCEVNDNIFDVPLASAAAKVFSDQKNVDIYVNALRRSDAVHVSSEPLVRRFAQFNRHIAVFANQLRTIPAPRPARTHGPLVLGWGGSAGHYHDLERIAPAVVRWLGRHPDVRLSIKGNSFFSRLFKAVPAERFHHEPGGSLEDFYRFAATLDIGLAPMLPTEFNRCRSDVKFLEYAAHGVVPVLQRFDPYLKAAREGETAFFFDNEQELEAVLDRLAADSALRQRVAAAGYDYVRGERMLDRHVRQRFDFYIEQTRRLGFEFGASAPALPELSKAAGLIQAGPGYWQLAAKSEAEQKYIEGVRAREARQTKRAMAAILEALRLAPDYHQAHCLHGICLWRQGRTAEALQAVATAVRLNPSYARGWQVLGDIHKSLAELCAQKTNQLNPPLT